MPNNQNKKTASALVKWYRQNMRPLPWRDTTDPYAIWVSEIILQQTTVTQGEAYYHRFLSAFPTIKALAAEPLDKVLKLWEGLGYYSRARNIHHSAQDIMERFGGTFPDNYKDIISLKGIGPYAAAAIGSFAFDLRHVVVDGNVLRVISRLYGIQEPVDETQTKKNIQSLAQGLLETQEAAEFNQAIMEFGALNCTYKNPGCPTCPLNKVCVAYKQNLVAQLPVKSKKIKKKNRYFHFLFLEVNKQVAIMQRLGKDIWQGLYQFPLIETEKKDADLVHELKVIVGKYKKEGPSSKWYKQTLTHQYIHARFYHYSLDQVKEPEKYILISNKDLKKYAWPKIINQYLEDSGYL